MLLSMSAKAMPVWRLIAKRLTLFQECDKPSHAQRGAAPAQT
jgi:hypothetical protein